MSEPHLLRDLQGGALTLTLNRPERLNALTAGLLADLTRALAEADRDPGVRVIVLTGAGRGFCAGQDVTPGQPMGDYGEHLRHTFNPLVTAMNALEKPLIAAVNGPVAGAGVSLALHADLRLFSENASLSMAFSSIALIPDAGSSWVLPRLLGPGRAFELAALSEKIGAAQAQALGLCERVLPGEDFAQEVQAYAERLADRPAHALRLTKRALREGAGLTLPQALELEAELQAEAGRHPEHAEGMAAFAERRPANFRGVGEG